MKGTLIPYELFSIITDHRGHADLAAIVIFSEIFYQARNGRKTIATAGSLARKYNLSKKQVRRAIKKLVELSLIKKEVKLNDEGVKILEIEVIHNPTAENLAVYPLRDIPLSLEGYTPIPQGTYPYPSRDNIKEYKNIRLKENNKDENLSHFVDNLKEEKKEEGALTPSSIRHTEIEHISEVFARVLPPRASRGNGGRKPRDDL